jgi:hypothetical protein
MKKISFHKFLPGIAWFFVVMVLTFLPGEDIPGNSLLERLYFDKWVHAGIFGLMVILFIRPIAMTALTESEKLRYYLRIAVTVALWGLATEFIQKYFIPGRSFDIWDFVADSVGCSLAYLFSKRYLLKQYP